MTNVLLAGSTGYLGSHIAKELHKSSIFFRTVVRNPDKLKQEHIQANEVIQAEVTNPESIREVCDNIDVVISTVGITKQKDNLTYMDVDYQANMNLLIEAKRSGVKKFVYVSLLNGESLQELKICEAKELFVKKLESSGLDYCIVRPNAFFSDMSEIFQMAKKGRVYLFQKGESKINPIHGEDLAKICVNAINQSIKEINVGGPETLTHNEIAIKAFDVLNAKPKITYIAEWIRKGTIILTRKMTRSKFYGPIEFFMTVMAKDMLAPECGKKTLTEHYIDLNNKTQIGD